MVRKAFSGEVLILADMDGYLLTHFWQKVMFDKLNAFQGIYILNMIDLPYGKSTIGCKWIYKIKTQQWIKILNFEQIQIIEELYNSTTQNENNMKLNPI